MPRTYTVQPGDSFARIAGKVYGDQRMLGEIQRANPNAGVLQPGQTIRLPGKKKNPVVTERELRNPAPLPTGQGDEVQETHVNPYSGLGQFFGPGSGQGGAETGFGQSAAALAEQITGIQGGPGSSGASAVAGNLDIGANEVRPSQDPNIVQPLLNPADRALVMRAARQRQAQQPAPRLTSSDPGTDLSDEEIFRLRRRGRLTQLRETARQDIAQQTRPDRRVDFGGVGEMAEGAWQWWSEGVREEQERRGTGPHRTPSEAQVRRQEAVQRFLGSAPAARESRFDAMLNETAADPSTPSPADLAHLNRSAMSANQISPEAAAQGARIGEVASESPGHLTMGQLAWAGRYTGMSIDYALQTGNTDRYLPTKLSTDMIMILPQYHRTDESGDPQFTSVSDFAHTMGYEWDDSIEGWRLRGAGGGTGRATGVGRRSFGGFGGFGGGGGGGGRRRRLSGQSQSMGPFQWRINIE